MAGHTANFAICSEKEPFCRLVAVFQLRFPIVYVIVPFGGVSVWVGNKSVDTLFSTGFGFFLGLSFLLFSPLGLCSRGDLFLILSLLSYLASYNGHRRGRTWRQQRDSKKGRRKDRAHLAFNMLGGAEEHGGYLVQCPHWHLLFGHHDDS